jgi:hypothetical protein
MLPDILNYVPDPKNGRPIAGGKVYFLIAGYTAPGRDSDLDLSKIAPVTANGLTVPQPIYTSQGGTLVVGSQVDQPDLIPDGTTQRVAVYDKCGKLVYQVGYSAIGPFVPSEALAATDSTVLVGGVEVNKLVGSVEYLTPEQFFVAGEVDQTGMIMRMSAAIVDGSRCEFQQKEYLISYAGTGLAPYSSAPYGVSLINLSDKKNVTLNGNNCTIKLVNHNIATNGGLMFCRGEFVPNLRANGFNFDYTCTGVNASASYYPWVGGFVIFDPDTGTNDETKISNDIYFGDMTFKLYHPNGQWSTTSNPYLGDPNNGYKLFTIFASGDYLAATKSKQNKNLMIKDITVKDGHNGYGLWAWAYNNVKFINPTAENYSSKYTNSAGAFVGVGVPFIRYHQFLCTDVIVENINFNGRKSSEKVGAFAGGNPAINFTTNNAGANYIHGNMEINGGVIRGGNGDLANLAQDQLILCTAYGVLKVRGIEFDAQPIDANSIVGGGIVYSSEATSGTGYGELHISDVTFSRNCDQYQNIQVLNGVSTSAADRRCKLLKIDNVVSMCQHQYGLDLSGNSTATYQGVERVLVDGLMIDGRACQTFDKLSTNSRAMFLASSSGDIYRFNRLTIDSKYYAMSVSDMDMASSFIIDDYEERDVTTRYLGAGKIAVKTLRGNGTPESVQVSAVGSLYSRLDGAASATIYVKESGAGNTGWIAK